MAGAVSAGAYTAGVLDFLIDALDEWQAAKESGAIVPLHDVSIEVISGASAGGMCAAISAVLLKENFEHIRDTSRTGTNNRFYEGWVNRIDITKLLGTDDLQKAGAPVVSLLDSTIIEEIASYALTPGASSVKRNYVSPDLTLFLSLTNLRGTPYSLNGASPGSIEETTSFFGDRIRFEYVGPGKSVPKARCAHALDFTKPGPDGGWGILKTAAIATGAFPLFLAPRILERNLCEYTPPMWESVSSEAEGTPPPIKPNFPPGTPDPLQTLNVDGGVTNNDPFNYAHDHLAKLAPALLDRSGKVSAIAADRATINVAPFPSTELFDLSYQPLKRRSIFAVMGSLLGALISQSRFFGESLNQVMEGATFDRFVIAPSDHQLASEHAGGQEQNQPPALQCASLGAFGGFFHRGFRAHDYALGRRNCQKFLRDSFVLPADNVIIKAGLDLLNPAARTAVTDQFKRPAPGAYYEDSGDCESGKPLPAAQASTSDVWFPIIPLCSKSLTQCIPRVERAKVSKADLDSIVKLILERFKKVVSVLLSTIPSTPLRIFLTIGQPVIRFLARGPLRDALIQQLGDAYKP